MFMTNIGSSHWKLAMASFFLNCVRLIKMFKLMSAVNY